MNKKNILSLIVIFTVSAVNAQTADSVFDLRAGLGVSKLEQSNIWMFVNEYEFNAKLTNHIAIAPSLVFNIKDHSGLSEPVFFQADINAFLSPFRNNRRNDFRVGGGLGFYKLSGEGYAARSAFGFNLIIENTFMINDLFFIGAKAFMQPYFNKESSSGVLLKAGVNF